MNRPTPPIRATEYGEVKHTRTDCSLGRGVTLGTHRSRRGRRYNNISLGAIPLNGTIAAMPDICPRKEIGSGPFCLWIAVGKSDFCVAGSVRARQVDPDDERRRAHPGTRER